MDIASSLLVPDWSRGSIRGNQGVVIAETGFKGCRDAKLVNSVLGTGRHSWQDISPGQGRFSALSNLLFWLRCRYQPFLSTFRYIPFLIGIRALYSDQAREVLCSSMRGGNRASHI